MMITCSDMMLPDVFCNRLTIVRTPTIRLSR
jgi:hypothetical protein